MDMKKILQAVDGASTQKPVEGSNDMKKFIQITEGKGPLNRLTQAESITLNTYNEYKPAAKPVAKPSLIDKYFKEVEVEFAESLEKKKEKATRLAERVIERVVPGQEPAPGINRLTGKPNVAEPQPAAAPAPAGNSAYTPGVSYPAAYTIDYNGKQYKFAGRDKTPQDEGEVLTVMGGAIGLRGLKPVKVQISADGMYYIAPVTEAGNYGHHSNFNRHVAQSKRPPENIINLAKKGARVDNNRRNKFEDTEGVDGVTLDVPLLIRLLEFAREDAKDDMILHKVVEKMIGMKEEGQSLTMSDYEDIVGQVSEAHPNSKIYDKCWTGYKKVPGKKRGEPGSCEKK